VVVNLGFFVSLGFLRDRVGVSFIFSNEGSAVGRIFLIDDGMINDRMILYDWAALRCVRLLTLHKLNIKISSFTNFSFILLMFFKKGWRKTPHL